MDRVLRQLDEPKSKISFTQRDMLRIARGAVARPEFGHLEDFMNAERLIPEEPSNPPLTFPNEHIAAKLLEQEEKYKAEKHKKT